MTAISPQSGVSLQKQRAVFLDRDGTLIEDCGYLREPREVIFFEETVDALRRLQRHARLFIVTNQSGVAKGLITAEEAECVNAFVMDYLQKQGIVITELYCCPHRRDEGCACIKPKPYFLHEAARKYGVDLKRSFVIGDHPFDIAFACNAGATGIYVLSGHGLKHRSELAPGGIIVPGIREAADWVLGSLALNEQERKTHGGA